MNLFIVLLACAEGAARGQKDTPVALSIHALAKLCAVCPSGAETVARRALIPPACV